jgi:hypothetical protein
MVLSYPQKLFLVKYVDCFALSERRRKELPRFFKQFPGQYSDTDIKEISDFLYLSESFVREVSKGEQKSINTFHV